MASESEQRLQQIAVQLEEISLWRDREYVELKTWTFDGVPVTIGSRWPKDVSIGAGQGTGTTGGKSSSPVVTIEHPTVQIPAHWSVEESYLALDPGGEAILYVQYSDQDTETFGVDPWHRRFPLRIREFNVRVEAVARFPFGAPNRDPHLSQARLVWSDPEITRLHHRLSLLRD